MALASAISAALPLQLRLAHGGPIAGVGLHIDAYYGCAGLYLLPDSQAKLLTHTQRFELGDWPISTDWNLADDHAIAFAAHWRHWDHWFYTHLAALTDEENHAKSYELHRVACQAMQQVEAAGHLNTFPKTDDFRIIIAEHDEPIDLSLERYALFRRTGTIRVFGDTQ
ncbi:MAG: hypothetical protein ACKV0T_25110 [Planctomycetales bacterium]